MKNRSLLLRTVPALVVLALSLLFVWALNRPSEDKGRMPSALQGESVPDFSLPALNRDTRLSEEILQGRWQLVNVWATWCPTCQIEHPYLMELARRGVPLVGINYKDEVTKARRYLLARGNPFRHTIVDADGDYGLELGVYGAPETFVVNPQGEVVKRHAGDLNPQVWRNELAPVWGGDNPYD